MRRPVVCAAARWARAFVGRNRAKIEHKASARLGVRVSSIPELQLQGVAVLRESFPEGDFPRTSMSSSWRFRISRSRSLLANCDFFLIVKLCVLEREGKKRAKEEKENKPVGPLPVGFVHVVLLVIASAALPLPLQSRRCVRERAGTNDRRMQQENLLCLAKARHGPAAKGGQ